MSSFSTFVTGSVSEPIRSCQVTWSATAVTRHSHVFGARLLPKNLMHRLWLDSYSPTIGVQLLVWCLHFSQISISCLRPLGYCSACDNVWSSDNFQVIMPRDRSILCACEQNIWTKACSLLCQCSTSKEAKDIGENDLEVDHRE